MNERHVKGDLFPMYFKGDPKIREGSIYVLYLESGPERERRAIKLNMTKTDL
jgi:hypothetical protein